MNKANKLILVVALVFALCAAVVQNFVAVPQMIESIADIEFRGGGQTVVAVNKDNQTQISLINAQGVASASVSIPMQRGKEIYVVRDIKEDGENNLYVLLNILDAYSGKQIRQEISLYDLSRPFFKQVQSNVLGLDDEQPVNYRWMTANSALILIGTDREETVATRKAYDLTSVFLKDGLSKPESVRTYNLEATDGIYEALSVGTQLAYTSRSGKLFAVDVEDSAATEIYPARVLEELMYPIFIAQQSTDAVYLGEQESGDILSLSLPSGETQKLKTGTEPFSGQSSYAPVNVVKMSMSDPENFAAVVKNKATQGYELVISSAGQVSVVSNIQHSLPSAIWNWTLSFLGWAVAIFLILQLARTFFHLIGNSRAILLKLAFSVIPILLIALTLFGFVAYRTYAASIAQSFEKQVQDEGNMLTALLNSDNSFEEIEYPYDYTKEAYRYLANQLKTRNTYTRSACYERGQLYTAVASDLPCFYPFDILMNAKAVSLYEQAAYSGKAQIGEINDANGKRIVCVTPIGGTSGQTVYLLETGVPIANVTRYTQVYLRNYIILAVLFVAAISLILTMVFRRILHPLGEIKGGLEEFSRGNRSVRLENNATDELSDIIRVFNKMANDTDIQIYNLRKANENYYKFIPQKLFELLGKKNLGELELDSSMEMDYPVLSVSLQLKDDVLNAQQKREQLNCFFEIINGVCEEHHATLLTDGVNLRSFKIICSSGADNAVAAALTALSRIDAVNAGALVQNHLQALFVLHKSVVQYGICGDAQRLIPTLISTELDQLDAQETFFRQLSSRLIVTQAAFSQITQDQYYYRYIGASEVLTEERFGLYDFYDCTTPEVTRLIQETKNTFQKAMELYREKRYYDAKNLFVMVLRQNQYDNVARYYIFKCEKNL